MLGDPMSFWRSMPVGMLLRSPFAACNIGEDPSLTLPAYGAVICTEMVSPGSRYSWFEQYALKIEREDKDEVRHPSSRGALRNHADRGSVSSLFAL